MWRFCLRGRRTSLCPGIRCGNWASGRRCMCRIVRIGVLHTFKSGHSLLKLSFKKHSINVAMAVAVKQLKICSSSSSEASAQHLTHPEMTWKGTRSPAFSQSWRYMPHHAFPKKQKLKCHCKCHHKCRVAGSDPRSTVSARSESTAKKIKSSSRLFI